MHYKCFIAIINSHIPRIYVGRQIIKNKAFVTIATTTLYSYAQYVLSDESTAWKEYAHFSFLDFYIDIS